MFIFVTEYTSINGKMRYIICFLLLFGGWSTTVSGQIRFVGCGEVIKNNYYGKTLYAIQDQANTQPFGRIVFTPEEGGHPWNFSWTYNGVPQPVADTDTLHLEVDLLGSGVYTFRAEREGMISQSTTTFHVFFDYVPGFSIRLTDLFNCRAISIAEVTDFVIPFYPPWGDNPRFEGDKTHIYYLVSDKTVPREFLTYEYAFKAKEEAIAVNDQDMTVTVTITDKFGFQWTSKPVEYKSVIPKAEAELELLNTVDVVGEVGEQMGQAPLEVVFHNNSVNADSYEWLLFKDTADMEMVVPDLLDSLLDEQVRTPEEFSYTYEHTGRYKVQLIAINDQGNKCQDTTQAYYVNVVESMVDVPNVFTPNGDGKNDIFMARALSVEDFHGVILNRWGRKVYEWSDPRGGWNGRINGKYASPGTYYYIITARGREKNNPPKYVKKGALMLIR